MTGDPLAGMFAGIGYVLLPVVINMSHEAKPHLPAAVLTLLAIIAAVCYIETSSRRFAILTGALCGASFAMVLTGAMSFILIPAMCFARWRARPPLAASRIKHVTFDLALSSLIGAAVYSVTNPFVLIHLLSDQTILQSNLGNSQAMYHPALDLQTLRHAASLIGSGASPVFGIVGAAAIVLFARRNDLIRGLMLIVCLPIAVQFVMLASEKPGEYARFGLLIDITLMLITIVGAASVLKQNPARLALMGLLCAGCCVWSAGYVWHFGSDATARTSRIIGAQRLETLRKRGAAELAVYSDPAPYCLPPANLFQWKITLLDPGAAPPSSADLLLKPIDQIPATNMPMRGYQFDYWTHPRLLDTPISWASKPFEAIVRRDFAGDAER